MKILQINKYFYHRGGVETHLFDLSYLLEKKGVEVGYFSVKDEKNKPTPFSKYFVNYLNFDKLTLGSFLKSYKIFYSFEAKNKLKQLLSTFYPDVAHLHLIYGTISPSILPVLKQKNIPTILTLHDWKLLCPNRMLYTKGSMCERCKNKKYFQCVKYRCVKNSFLQSLAAAMESCFHEHLGIYRKNIDLFIAPSQFVKNTFVKFGWPKEKIKVLPHFLSEKIKKVDTPPSLPKVARFAFIGRLSEEKGIDKLVKFWLDNNITYPLDIFGDGPLYKKLSAKIKLSENHQICLHGQTEHSIVIERIKDFSAIIMPSVVHETFGYTAIESWSQGVPVVASNLGAFTELCQNSGAGILFDWADENSLEKALHNIQNMKYRRQAVEYMKSNHLPEEYLGNLFSIYRGLKKK